MANFTSDRDGRTQPETPDFNSSLLEVLKDILLTLRQIELHLQAASDEEFDHEDVDHDDH